MERGLVFALLACLACGPPAMPASGRTLAHDDLINGEMCEQMNAWVFKLARDEISVSSYDTRKKLRELERQAKRDDEITRCTERVAKAQYLCVMAARKLWQAMKCETENLAASGTATLEPVDATWLEVKSDHFVLWTDLDTLEAERLLRRLEDVRAALLAVFFGGGEVDVRRSRVIAPATLNSWRRYAGTGDTLGRAYPAEASPFREALLLVSPGVIDADHDTVVTHELVHHVIFTTMRRPPRWLSEGLATYFETVQLDRTAGEVYVGQIPGRVQRTLDRDGGVHLAPLVDGRFDGDVDGYHASDYYASSYLLTAYLVGTHAKGLATYQRLIKQVGRDGYARAWRAAFPTLDPATMQPQIARWWLSGGHRPFRVKLPPAAAVSLATRPMPLADTYAARAILYFLLSDGRKKEAAELNLDAALREAPHHVLAHVLAIALRGSRPDVELARALVREHPDDWMAHALLILALPGDSPERAEAVREHCKRVAANPAVTVPDGVCPP